MTIPTSAKEELLSKAHVDAIAAAAGYTCEHISKDYGTDLEIRRVVLGRRGNLICGGPVFDIQLKATINWGLEEGSIFYDIEADAYNKLVERNTSPENITPIYLVLCCLPREEDDWLSAEETRLTLKNCCYYCYIGGSETENSSSLRIRIPREQLLTPASLQQLVEQRIGGLAA